MYSCCNATESQLPTCSNPLFQTGTPYQASDPTSDTFCPTPPSVAVGSQETGPLDSMNVYVAEQLLRVSLDVDPAVFFQQFVAGYVTHSPDSPYSTCACEDEQETDLLLTPAHFTPQLLAMINTAIAQVVMPDPADEVVGRAAIAFSLLTQCNTDTFANLSLNGNWSDSYNGFVDMCIDVASCKDVTGNGLPSNFNLTTIYDAFPDIRTACQCSSECLAGKQSPVGSTSGGVSATIWYNNQVRILAQ